MIQLFAHCLGKWDEIRWEKKSSNGIIHTTLKIKWKAKKKREWKKIYRKCNKNTSVEIIIQRNPIFFILSSLYCAVNWFSVLSISVFHLLRSLYLLGFQHSSFPFHLLSLSLFFLYIWISFCDVKTCKKKMKDCQCKSYEKSLHKNNASHSFDAFANKSKMKYHFRSLSFSLLL